MSITETVLRSAAGRSPYDKDLTDLIGELTTRSEEFRTRWAGHGVKYHRTGRKRLHHPIVGDLDLSYEALELPADRGLRVNVYTADPGAPSEDALKVLASWAATQRETAEATVKQKCTSVPSTTLIIGAAGSMGRYCLVGRPALAFERSRSQSLRRRRRPAGPWGGLVVVPGLRPPSGHNLA